MSTDAGADRPTHHCRITAPASPDSIDEIQDMLDQLWSDEPTLTSIDRMRFEGAVVEVANNIVEHAVVPPGRDVVTIRLSVTCAPRHLRACFEDDGAPSALQLAEADPTMPDWSAESGRGLAMVQMMTDELRYEPLEAGNRWSITCSRST